MASFEYRAIDAAGTLVAGTMVADTAADARDQLRRRGLFPEEVKRTRRLRVGLIDRLPGSRARASTHVSVFTRQCSVLLMAGVPLVEALGVTASQTEHRGFGGVLREIREAVNSGVALADAMVEYPRFFDGAYVGMIAFGEKAGALQAVFAHLAEFLERRRALRAKVGTALIYPAILMALLIGLVLFLTGYVVPKIKPLLELEGRAVPLSAAILFGVGDFLWNYGPAMLAVLAGVAALAGWLVRTRRGRAWLDRVVLRLPVVRKAVRKAFVARFTMTFAALLRAGVPAMEALETLSRSASNTVFAREIARVRKLVIEGREISEGMSDGGVFPPMVSYMVSVGERSGSLPDVLEHVSQAASFELEVALQRGLAALEPAIILVMAGLVGYIAMSLMTAILELSRF